MFLATIFKLSISFLDAKLSKLNRFNVDRAVNLGVKSRDAYNLLQEGYYVTLENGQKVLPTFSKLLSIRFGYILKKTKFMMDHVFHLLLKIFNIVSIS